MPKLVQNYLDSFIGHLKYIELTRSKMEQLFSRKTIVRRDIEFIYEGIYLNAVTQFENFIENLFINLLSNKAEHPSKAIKPKLQFSSAVICRDIVCAGKSYIDWFPYDKTIKRAKIYFKKGLPFTALEKADKKEISEILYIRNAIAHNSKHSVKMFAKHLTDESILTPREKTPAGFLRSNYVAAPPQTRYEFLISQIIQISRKLCV